MAKVAAFVLVRLDVRIIETSAIFPSLWRALFYNIGERVKSIYETQKVVMNRSGKAELKTTA